MISYSIYKIVHFLGIFMVLLSMGGVAMHSINRGTKDHAWRKPAAITHAIGLLLVLVGGFGLLARLGIVHGGLPVWVQAKLAVWLSLGILYAVITRKPNLAKPAWLLILALASFAAYTANYKPF